MSAGAAREPLMVHCSVCGHEWAAALLPEDAAVLVRALKRANTCPKCRSTKVQIGPQPKPTPAGKPHQWLENGDTGTSSLTIWAVMMGTEPDRADIPHDPADFGRCFRLLLVMPSWRGRLGEVAERYPAWRRLVDRWAELESLWLEESPTGRCPKLYALMQQLRGVA